MLQPGCINGEVRTTQRDGAPPNVIAVIRGHHPQFRGNLGRNSRSASSQEGLRGRHRSFEDQGWRPIPCRSPQPEQPATGYGPRRPLNTRSSRASFDAPGRGPRAVSRSAKTARWQGASSSPASFSRAYCATRSGSCPASASALQVSKLRRIAARRSGSSTRINRQGWLSPTDGARQASSSTFSIEPCGSGSGRNRRTSRRQISNSRNRARKAASNAGTGGIAISGHQLTQYGTGRSTAAEPRQRPKRHS
jgi:hypothetical protein